MCNEPIEFNVRTRDSQGRINYNTMDDIQIRVYDPNRNKINVRKIKTTSTNVKQKSTTSTTDGKQITIPSIDVKQITTPADSGKMITSPSTDDHTSDDSSGVYSFFFTPLREGKHEVLVQINDMELSPPSYQVLVYKKSNLTFETENERKKYTKSESSASYFDGCGSNDDQHDSSRYTFFFYRKVCKRAGAKTFLIFWTFWG